MKIYFTRHGETEWNSRDVICGTTDIGLTARGIGQAEALAADIAVDHRDIDMIICSPMKRAMATAAPIGAALEIEPVTDSRLREWNYGSYEGRPRDAEGYADAKLEFGCRMPDGGESVFDVVSRVYGLIDELREKYADKTILLVCHGGVCRVIETYYRNMTRKEFSCFFMGNCELRSFDTETCPHRTERNETI